MSHRKLLRELESLPAEAQRQVEDFVALLKKQHELVSHPAKQNGSGMSQQPFIGMWQDREDLKNSAEWVRQTRKQEWSDS